MPTGYTADLCEREQSFQEFAMTCARAFGATITMRDESLDVPIPETFEPSPYYQTAYDNAVAELSRLKAMDSDAALAFSEANKAETLASLRASLTKTLATRNRIQEMKAKVIEWTPPTPDHAEMKTFMLQQLQETLRFDGNTEYTERSIRETEAISAETIYVAAVRTAERNVEYYAEQMQKERDRAGTRTEWVKQLRDSLAVPVSQ